MRGKRVLVTGGAGFIGSNLANHLAADNEVIALDDCHLGTPENLDGVDAEGHADGPVEFVDGSVLDEDLPTDVDVVFHLAAYSSYTMVEENKRDATRVNVEGFVNTVEQAREDGCDTVVYATTSSIYGSRTEPSPEDMPVAARTCYEASEPARDRWCGYFGRLSVTTMAGLRFFSVYQGYGGAEEHKGEYANTVAQFADDVAHGEAPVLFGDGTQTRDFTHVDDVVRAIELAADHELQGIYNVGTGESYDFNTMVEMINDELGTDVDPEYVENPLPVYVHDTMADASKLRAATGWEPEIGFEDGVARVCAPYRDDDE